MAPAPARKAWKHARYGPRDRYPAPPAGGFCLSAFAVLEDRGRVALGRAAPHARWLADWYPQWAVYPEAEREAPYQWRLLPATYLKEGEHPGRALGRVMRDQVRASGPWKASPPEVVSTVSRSDWYRGAPHWDLAFVYHVRGAALPGRPPPWWAELEWVPKRQFRAREFGWNADLAKRLGVAR